MSVDPDLLYERFDELAGRVGPSRRIDVDRAVADARHMLARRRRARGGLALSAMALAGAVAVFFTGGAPEGKAPATPTASASFPRTAHDPVAVGLSFGWLPPGLYAHTPEWPSMTNVNQSYLMAEADTEATRSPSAPGVSEVALTLYTMPAGALPHPLQWEGVQSESDVGGPSIGGGPSWIETPRTGYWSADGLGVVVWKLPDGGWAVLNFRDNSNDGRGSGIFSRANVIRIAQSATQTPDPVALPFRITGALAQADITEVQSASTNGTNAFQPYYRLTVTFRDAGAEIALTVRAEVQDATASAPPGQVCTPITGKSGVVACVAVHGTLPPALASGGPRGVLDDIDILNSETTDVIQ